MVMSNNGMELVIPSLSDVISPRFIVECDGKSGRNMGGGGTSDLNSESAKRLYPLNA